MINLQSSNRGYKVFALINQRQVFYTIQGNGRPLFLLHDRPGMDHTHLHPWLDGLSSYAQLISYTPCDQGCAAQLVEADALRDYLQHERIMLFGFGYGGLLAQAYTLRFPKRVMGVILCSLPVNDGNTAVANLFNQLYQIEAPTLILAGRRDTICPPDQTAERCHASLPNSRLVIFDESGHCPFVDEGERFTAVVGSWLSQFDKT